jgi:predicted aspartyl protease
MVLQTALMYWAFWILLSLPAFAETTMMRSGAHWSIEGIYVDGHGPFRFLLDTGAQSTVVDPAVAERIGLRPSYRVEVVSVNGSQVVPAVAGVQLRVDGHTVAGEVLVQEVALARRSDPLVVGILGQSALAGLSYELDLRRERFRVGGEGPAGGIRLPYGGTGDRPVVLFGGMRLVLDSGAGSVILFRSRYPGVRRTGQVEVASQGGEKRIAQAGVLERWNLGEFELRDVPVVLHPNGRSDADGLLPVGLFSRVHVDPKGLITLQM